MAVSPDNPVPSAEEDVGGDAVSKVDESDAFAAFCQVDPAESFSVARGIIASLHKTLDLLKGGKAADGAESDTASQGCLDLQRQMLALRRAHRATAVSIESGRAAEMRARRLADAQRAHLATLKYESECCRASVRRLRAAPLPELSALRPVLEVAEEDDEVDMVDGDASTSKLAKCLESEGAERALLMTRLDALKLQLSQDSDAKRRRKRAAVEMLAKLRVVHQGFETDLSKMPSPVASSAEEAADPGAQAVSAEGNGQCGKRARTSGPDSAPVVENGKAAVVAK